MKKNEGFLVEVCANFQNYWTVYTSFFPPFGKWPNQQDRFNFDLTLNWTLKQKKNKKEIRRKEKKIQARFIKPGNSLWKLDLICEKEKK